jgi:hypothetical protein
MNQITHITEQCGARWNVFATDANGDRAIWVQLALGYNGKSVAKPNTLGFYVTDVNAACKALAN